MPRTDVSFKTSDGVTLRGWFFTPPPTASGSSTGIKLPCLILTHGLSCIKEMGLSELATKFSEELNMTCLVYDHRGFGTSDTAPGQPRQEVITWLQTSDMRDAITYVQGREDVDRSKVALWGYSLSAAEAVYVAAIDRRVTAVIALGPGMDGTEIVRRMAPPHAMLAMQGLFEMERLARADGKDPTRVPVVSNEPGVQATLPSQESWDFFSKWATNGSTWKNELTVRSLEDVSTFALPISHLDKVTPTPVLFEVGARDTNSPPDMSMRWYAKLSEPKEVVLVDADHYQLMVDGKFQETSADADAFLKTRPEQGVHFAKRDLFQDNKHLRDHMCTDWAYPSMLWEKICREANGYAGSARSFDGHQQTRVDTSWFQFLIKQLKPRANASQQTYDYHWYEMGFFIYALASGAAVAFCFDTPQVFQVELLDSLNSGESNPPKEAMAFLQCAIVIEVSRLYDFSVWSLRDQIRAIEKKRSDARYVDSSIDFAQLHDLARHTIHTCEVLAVAADTLTTLLGDYRSSSGRICECSFGPREKPDCPHNKMWFWLGLLQNFGRRAKSLNDRLSNEINLGFNLVVQRDTQETVTISRMTVDISSAARGDSASMKTISVVTLAFLPATFVCTIFSMSFFTLNVDDSTGEKHWLISEYFWIYWVITVPLTVLTLICWWLGQRKEDRREEKKRLTWKSATL
ncbi:hypothetical protein AYL99_11380 [Fonsecaea erecta]|uniref:AB hydrolase-1 domain-containing protein n=1 Tax=Fonsecaea erecta TaxID=1367422 RepID=A0A178Z3C7_9EURO|nr:hypothetical protein AYL99_11380 [Fonsecaea erecta]OAP54279.1 hypothetical protein AYL99_11380 [Fonsecaea erecta]